MGTFGKTAVPTALVPRIVGEIGRRHPALPELALDGVAVSEGGRQLAQGVGHRHASSILAAAAARMR
jgi:hypothetical protein